MMVPSKFYTMIFDLMNVDSSKYHLTKNDGVFALAGNLELTLSGSAQAGLNHKSKNQNFGT